MPSAASRPSREYIALSALPSPGVKNSSLPSRMQRMETSGRPSAQRRAACRQAAPSALSLFEELAPGGRVVKQPAHGYAGALRRAGGAHLLYVPGLEAHVRALGRTALTGGELYVRNAGDSCQRLTAEAQRADGLQPALVGELAGGVAQEGHAGVLGRHAAAVVRDADELRAAAGELHRYVARPRVDGVFNELLHRRGGPLHDLARGYEVGHVRG